MSLFHSFKHYINVTHVKKNICDSLIRTLLNIKGKMKDDVNGHLDLLKMNN